MNITDIEQQDVVKTLNKFDCENAFDLLLKIGQEYQKEYKTKPIDIGTKEGQTEFRRISWYIVEELCEMVNLLKIREWTDTQYIFDDIHFAEEYADFMNFVIQIPIMLDWNEKKIKDIIIRKYLVNKFRKESKY